MSLEMRFREYSIAAMDLMRQSVEWDPEAWGSAHWALQNAYFKEERRGYDMP
jgi:hypothetical protein